MSIVATTVLSIAILCVPNLMKQVIDRIAGTGATKWSNLLAMGITIILLELFSGICTYYFRTAFSTKAVAQYRSYAFHELLDKDIQGFYIENSSTYSSALVNDITSIKDKYLAQIPIISQIFICCIGAVVIMLRYNVWLTLIAVAISFIPFLAAVISGKNLTSAETDLSERNSKYMVRVKDIFGGVSTIKSFKAEHAFNSIYNRQCESVQKSQRHREQIIEKVNYHAAISGYITRFSVLFACIIFSFYDDKITSGTVIAFSQLINYLIDPVTNLPPMLADTKASLALVDKLGAILDKDEKQEKSKKLSPLEQSIQFKHVSYSYQGDPAKKEYEISLKDISFDIEAGKCYIIVGASGSGKSTLLKLIMGMLRDVSDDEIYKAIAFIQQETVIFNSSILENITMYQEFSQGEIEEAIKQSGLTELVSQKGLQYLCGENGSALSGGERQRIAIARSLIRHTNVLLADEITAALDANTSFHVMSSIMELKDIARILVLHDLDENILRQADEIITLRNGSIIEKGSFDELMERKDYFYSLFTVSK